MDDLFASIPITNESALCVGEITNEEAERARSDGMMIDGFGYYLFMANQVDPRQPVELLAKFTSSSAAERLARLLDASRPI